MDRAGRSDPNASDTQGHTGIRSDAQGYAAMHRDTQRYAGIRSDTQRYTGAPVLQPLKYRLAIRLQNSKFCSESEFLLRRKIPENGVASRWRYIDCPVTLCHASSKFCPPRSP